MIPWDDASLICVLMFTCQDVGTCPSQPYPMVKKSMMFGHLPVENGLRHLGCCEFHFIVLACPWILQLREWECPQSSVREPRRCSAQWLLKILNFSLLEWRAKLTTITSLLLHGRFAALTTSRVRARGTSLRRMGDRSVWASTRLFRGSASISRR